MNSISFDITNVLSTAVNKEGLENSSITTISEKLHYYNRELWAKPYPFMDLPVNKFQFSEMKKLCEVLNTKKLKNIVLLGIGGSSLGTETIFNALLKPFHNLSDTARGDKPKYFILDNIDPNKINMIIDIITPEKEDTLLVAISKSGETPETISQFMIFKELLGNAKERIVVITDKEKGILKEIANKEGYPVLNVPDGVGGRFSVLTPVSIFPAAVMGIDIDEIMEGAKDMAQHIKEKSHNENMAIILASILYLMDKQGKNIHVMMPYCERLSGFADWFRQLEGESLGKNMKGPTPLKSIGVTDQHSQLQLYIDGPKDKFITLIYSADDDRTIPNSFTYIESIDYLAGKNLRDLFYAEFLGTTLSITESNTPNLIIIIDKISGYNLGALFMLYEMVIAYLGYLYEVNPFDQPGVEQGKIYTKAIMGKKGLEDKKETIDSKLSFAKTIIKF
ncbi:MAG: glucose-6-phosphate isomerase [Proteobacteria bacterium]|nr:glucose-6-phosphate isomerase [Pseudomonadota bacterium]